MTRPNVWGLNPRRHTNERREGYSGTVGIGNCCVCGKRVLEQHCRFLHLDIGGCPIAQDEVAR